MAFIIDKDGNYIPVLGETSGGGSSANYLPAGTTFTIEEDGTGDFATITDASDFLSGKWSDGTVTFEVGEGTFNNSKFQVRGDSLIKNVVLVGKGTNKTTVNLSANDYAILSTSGSSLTVKDINFVQTNGTKQYRGANAGLNSFIEINNCSFSNFSGFTVGVIQGGRAFIRTSLTITDCGNGIESECGFITSSYGVNISMTNVTNGVSVLGGGTISLLNPNYTLSNVSNQFSQTKNTVTSGGIIFSP